MKPLEFEIPSERESWYMTHVPGPARYDSRPGNAAGAPTGGEAPGSRPGPWPPSRRPGPWPPGRRPGPWPTARQDYLDETASPWGGGRVPEVVADAPSPPWEQPDRSNGRGGDGTRPTPDHPASPGHLARPGAIESRRAEPAPAMGKILLAAEYQAAAMTQLASYQAAMITQQVAYEAEDIRDAAKREADHMIRRAAVQAASVREAAEMEAAELRHAIRLMQAELNVLATRLAGALPDPVLARRPQTERSPADRPATRPTQPEAPPLAAPGNGALSRHAAQPARRPEPRPTGRPEPRPAGRPEPRPTGRPEPRPTGRPEPRPTGKPEPRPAVKPPAPSAKTAPGQGRQAGAMRVAAIASSALLLLAAVAGATEIYLHGFAFFVFRSVGTGETGRGPGGLTESQGPGQPDAPKPTPSHGPVRPITRSAVTVHHG